MTKTNFVQRAKGFREHRDWLAWLVFGVLMVVWLSWDKFKAWGSESGPAWLPGVLEAIAALTLVFLIAAVLLVGWNRKRRARQAGLVCPHCADLLMDQSGEIAIATGNCGKCGERVFSDTLADPAATPDPAPM